MLDTNKELKWNTAQTHKSAVQIYATVWILSGVTYSFSFLQTDSRQNSKQSDRQADLRGNERTDMEGWRGGDDASFIASLYYSICSTLFCACFFFSFSLSRFFFLCRSLFVFRVPSLGDCLSKCLRERDKHLRDCWTPLWIWKPATITRTHTHTTHGFWVMWLSGTGSKSKNIVLEEMIHLIESSTNWPLTPLNPLYLLSPCALLIRFRSTIPSFPVPAFLSVWVYFP